ncbi:MAG: hypothetical protein P1V21_19815 [Rhizobiaceae bacterium]|nr:hypothetical protein [Rhizobiaceae bacterium]
MDSVRTLCLFVAVWLLIANGLGLAEAKSTPPDSQILFRNDTDATMRIDAIVEKGDKPISPQIVQPHAQTRMSVPAGSRTFELIAFRANPVRIHRIKTEVSEGTTSQFNISAHMMGLYLLEDAGALASIAALPTGVPNKIKAPAVDIAERCRRWADISDRAIIWNHGAAPTPMQYYQSGALLCAVDGSHAFHEGAIYEHYVCRNAWQDCVRHSDGDAFAVPVVRTSSFIDIALRLAREKDAHADFARTQSLEWVRGERPASWLTRYHTFGNLNLGRECPPGYRLHYQGKCINIADALADDPDRGVRMVEPEIDR